MNLHLALLTLCQGLLMVNNVTFIAINGLVGLALAPVGWMATVPITAYVAKPEVNAVVHAHPPHCTALAIRGMEIPAVHYMIAISGGPNIRCAGYQTYGTQELSQAAIAAMKDRTCCLLANHGMVATGPSLGRAMWLAVEVEDELVRGSEAAVPVARQAGPLVPGVQAEAPPALRAQRVGAAGVAAAHRAR